MRKGTVRRLVCAAACLLLCGACAPRDARTGTASAVSASIPDGYPYQTEPLYAYRDGKRIFGEITIPQGAGEKMPAVIFSHGFGGTHAAGTQYAQALARRGYVVYCFDFCGGSPSSQSDGSTLEMSLFTQREDLEAVLSMVQELEYVDRDNLFLLGTSQGGAVSAVTAARHTEQIRGMMLLYPAFVMVDDANARFQSVEEIPAVSSLMGMYVGRAYFAALLDYDIYGDIAAYDRDVLLIHGDADSLVPLAGSQRAQKAYPSAELKVIPGAGHGFYGADAQQAIDWMDEYLQSHRTR